MEDAVRLLPRPATVGEEAERELPTEVSGGEGHVAGGLLGVEGGAVAQPVQQERAGVPAEPRLDAAGTPRRQAA